MTKVDITTKALLAAIVVLLGVLVLRPVLPIPSAQAQSHLNDGRIELGYRVPNPSIISIPEGEVIREIQTVDSAQAFLVRYDDRIEVYRVQVMAVDPEVLKEKARRN